MAATPAKAPELLQEDVDVCAAVFARFAKRLNNNVDEYHAFQILREFIVSPGIGMETVDEIVELINTTVFNPAIDTLH